MIESKEENDLRSQSLLVSEEQNKMKSNEESSKDITKGSSNTIEFSTISKNTLKESRVASSEAPKVVVNNEVLDFASIVAKGTPSGTELKYTMHI